MAKFFSRTGFSYFFILVDVAVVALSIFSTLFMLRNNLDAYENNKTAILSILPYVVVAYVVLCHIFELDKPKGFTFFDVAYSISLTIICLFFITMALSFASRFFAYPRSILLISSAIQIIILTPWHYYINRRYYKNNMGKTSIVVGYDRAIDTTRKLLTAKGMEADIKYICSPRARRLKTLILECEMVFMADDVEAQQKNDIIKFCLDNRRGIIFVPAFSDIFTFNSHFSQIDDMPAFQVKPLKISFTNLLVKRFLDVALCLAALVVCILPMLMIAICMKAGGGSVFYRQKRVTKGGRVFNMIKFRTMVENAESMSGPVTSTGNDPRITRLGHFLRATRFDELPQIINILKGDMTIVGPRPERPFFVEKYAAEIPEYNLRHTVKAGLTGFAQVQGKYSTTIRDKLKYDLMYINGYKLADDIKLMMQTANILLKKESAEGWQEYAEVERAIEKIEKVTD